MWHVSNKNKVCVTSLGTALKRHNINCLLTTFVLVFIAVGSTVALAGTSMPDTFTYQGRLMDASGTAPLTGNLTLTIEILNPSKTCLLYSERQLVDTTATSGLFSIQIGNGTKTNGVAGYEDDPGYAFSEIFTNKQNFPSVAGSCAGGYSPAITDHRTLRVNVYDGSTTTTLADQTLSPVPQASVADTIDGVALPGLTLNWADDLARPVNPVVGMHGYNYDRRRFERWTGAAWVPTTPKFSAAAVGDLATDNHVLRWNNTNQEWEPASVAGLLGDPGGDVGGTYANMVVEKIQGSPVANVSPNDGEVLQWDGGTGEWVPTDLPAGFSTSGTAGVLAMFNAGGDNIVDSSVSENASSVVVGKPIDMSAQQVKNVANPTDPQDAVTLSHLETYVDTNLKGYVEEGTTNGEILVWDTDHWEPASLPAGFSMSGTANTIPKFNAGGDNLTDSSISDNGSLVTVGAPLHVTNFVSTTGPLAIAHQVAPAHTTGYGKIYVKADNGVYFMDDVGNENQFVFGTGAGEVNTASNLGGDQGLYASKDGVDLEFKGLTAGTNITLTPSATDITIATTGLQSTLTVGTDTNHYLKWDGDSWEPAFVSAIVSPDGSENLSIDDAGVVTASSEFAVSANADLAHKAYVDAQLGAIDTEDILPDGTGLLPFLKWDGDSWEPSALTTADVFPAMTDAQIIVSNNTTPTAVSMSGDATIANTGAITIANDAITTAKIDGGAVTTDKLAAGTVNGQIMYWDTNGTGQWTLLDMTGIASGKIIKWDATCNSNNGCWALGDDAGASGTVASIEGQTGTVDLQSTVASGTNAGPTWSSPSAGNINLNIPLASDAASTTGGLLTNAEYSALAGKQDALPTGAANQYLKWDTGTSAWVAALVNSIFSPDGSESLSIADSGVVTASSEYTVTNNTDLAHKAYVDAQLVAIDTEDVLPNGDTLTPFLKWDGDSWEASALTTADVFPAMTDAQIIVSNNTTPAAVSMSGDATIANTGAITIANDAVTTAKIDDGAVTTAKLAAGTVNGQIMYWDTNGTGQWTLLDMTGVADGKIVKWDATCNTNNGCWALGDDAGASGTVASIEGLTGTIDLQNAAAGDAPNWTTAGSNITLNIPLASTGASVTSGTISNADYVAFSGKQDALPTGAANQYLKWDTGSSAWVSALVNSIFSPDGSESLSIADDGIVTASSEYAVTNNTDLAHKAYVDAQVSGATNVNDGTVTGQILKWNDVSGNWEPSSLADGAILVGDGTGLANEVTVSGDASLDNTGKVIVTGLQDKPVPTLTADGQGFFWDQTNTTWKATDVTGLQDGYVMKWDDTAKTWEPSPDAGASGTVASIEGLTGTIDLESTVTSGTDAGPTWSAAGSDITLNIPLASDTATTTGGLITKAQYDDFDGKQDALPNGDVATPYLKWDGSAWTPSAADLAAADIPDLSSTYVTVGGDPQTVTGDKTFSGAVLVPAPSADEHAATKLYVDTQLASANNVTDGTANTEVLRWDGTDWTPVAMSGDATIADGVVTVQGFRDVALDATAPTTKGQLYHINATGDGYVLSDGSAAPTEGQVLSWDNTANKWKPVDLPTGVTIAGTASRLPKYNAAGDGIVDSAFEMTSTGTLNFVGADPGISIAGERYFHTTGSTDPWTSNMFWGPGAGSSTPTGTNNYGFGYRALRLMSTGNHNVAIGDQVMSAATTGASNVSMGNASMSSIVTGSANTALGYEAGLNANAASSNNIFLGHKAGPTAVGEISNRLYIDVGATNTPLIYGEFDNDFVRINNNLEMPTISTPDDPAANHGKVYFKTDGLYYKMGSTETKVGTGTGGMSSLGGLSDAAQLLAIGTAGDAPAWSSATATHTLNIPLASAGSSVTAGLVSNAEVARIPAAGTAEGQILRWDNTAGAWAVATGISVDENGYLTLPGAPTVDEHAATKAYVDAAAAGTLPTMTDGQIIVADASGEPAAVAMSGDATILNTGAVTVTAIQGQAVHTAAPSDGEVLTWNNTDSRWEAVALPAAGSSDIRTSGPVSTVDTSNWIGPLSGPASPPAGAINNTAAGAQALDGALTGAADNNTAFGFSALTALTSGDANTAMGSGAGDALTTGQSNVAIGSNSLTSVATRYGNVAIGAQSLQDLTGGTGDENTAIGFESMRPVTSGNYNVAIGGGTLGGRIYAAASNSHSTAVGRWALGSATGSYANDAFGNDALGGLTSGSNNVALGSTAGNQVTDGAANVIIGSRAGRRISGNSTGNIIIGSGNNNVPYDGAGPSTAGPHSNQLYIHNRESNTPLIHGDFSTRDLTINGGLTISTAGKYFNYKPNNAECSNDEFLKWDATNDRWICGTATGSSDVRVSGTGNSSNWIGPTSGPATPPATADNNTAAGHQALMSVNNNTAVDNTAFGSNALAAVTSSDGNTAFGANAGLANTVGTWNTYIGTNAGRASVGTVSNVAIGHGAYQSNTDIRTHQGGNVAIGFQSLYSFNAPGGTGHHRYNTAVGAESMFNIVGGEGNVAIGTGALKGSTGGRQSGGTTAVGFGALSGYAGTDEFNGNDAFGAQALGVFTTGLENVAVGKRAGYNITSGSGNVLLGSKVGPTVAGAYSNKLYIHNAESDSPLIYGDFAGGTLRVNGALTATSYADISDKRLKENITALESPLEKILKLRPVKFDWIETETRKGTDNIGFLAQEVEEVYPEFVTTNEDGYKAVKYGTMVSPLVGAVQELHNMSKMSEAQMAALDARLANTERKIASLEEQAAQQQREIDLLREQVQFLMKEMKK